MDIFIYISNVITMLLLLCLYIFSIVLMLADDDEMKWSILANGLSALLAYNVYRNTLMLISPKESMYLWLFLLLTTFILLIVAFVKKKTGVLLIILSLAEFVLLGICPLVAIYMSNKAISLIPKMDIAFNINLESYAPYILCVIFLIIILYLNSCFRNSIKNYLLNFDHRLYEMDKMIKLNANFEEPYSRYIREDLREMMSDMLAEMKDELKNGNVSSKGIKKGNLILQEQLLKELRSLKQNKLYSPQQAMPFSFAELTSNIKHSLTTPLSQIQTNCEVLRPNLQGEDLDRVLRIDNYSKICLSIINAYVEANTVSPLPSFMSLKSALKEYSELIISKKKKENVVLSIKDLPDIVEGYSGNYIFALLIPLLQNSITASPNNAKVLLTYDNIDGIHKISVTNRCDSTIPSIEQLNTTGFSTKRDHMGIGILSVRNLLSLVKGCNLLYNVQDDMVKATINLKIRR